LTTLHRTTKQEKAKQAIVSALIFIFIGFSWNLIWCPEEATISSPKSCIINNLSEVNFDFVAQFVAQNQDANQIGGRVRVLV
jgi:hypothetical protein